MSKFQIGDRVRGRSGAELKQFDRLKLVGEVVETSDIPAYGDAIRIHWPDREQPEISFSEAALFDRVGGDA